MSTSFKDQKIDKNQMDLKESENFIKLWVKQFHGATYEVWISKDEQIFNLKLKLEIEEDIPVIHQTLFYGDDELNDSFTIEEYEIEYGATLRLQVLDRKLKKQPSIADQTFAIDEKTYNLLFDKKNANIKNNKHYSLTDSKSIDEFRLLNTNSGLGCISVNENTLDDFDYKTIDERTTNKKDKMDQLLIRMQKLSFSKKLRLPYLEDDAIRFNKLKNVKRLSGEMERKNFVRFRSNSSFDLIVDYDKNENCIANDRTKQEANNELVKMNRPMSVLLGTEKKQIRFTSSVFKPINVANAALENRRLSIDLREPIRVKVKKVSSDKNSQKFDKKKSNIPLGRIKLPKLSPVDLRIKKGGLTKVKKKSVEQVSRDKDDTCGIENSLIGNLNVAKGKKKLPKL